MSWMLTGGVNAWAMHFPGTLLRVNYALHRSHRWEELKLKGGVWARSQGSREMNVLQMRHGTTISKGQPRGALKVWVRQEENLQNGALNGRIVATG